MSEDKMLQEAVDAISQGQRGRAKDLLTRLLRANQKNHHYWLWMSSVVDTPTERIYCLESALRLDPENLTARRGLVLLGARPPEDSIKPVPPIRRKWGAALGEEDEAPKTRLQKILSNPAMRVSFFMGLAVLMIGLVYLGVFGVRKLFEEQFIIVQVSISPVPQATFTETPTLLATKTPAVRTPTPTFAGAPPLWTLLEATYTPVPLYVNTPHPVNDAYRAGLRAYARDDYSNMLKYMLQACEVDPNLPDTRYYVGEAYRLQGNYAKALDAYNRSIEIDSAFAPAYLGRIRVLLETDPNADLEDDFEKAFQHDPQMVDTYLLHASYLLNTGDSETVLEDLQRVEELYPESPELYLYRAQALLLSGEPEAALENAIRAYELNQTLLPVYLLLGQAYLAKGDPGNAQSYLDVYMRYEEEDLVAWMEIGRVHLQLGKDFESALEAFDRVLEEDKLMTSAYYYRGLTYLALEEGQAAVNDMAAAMRLEPKWFHPSLGMGHALLVAGRPNDAYNQLRSSLNLATTDEELAQIYYWRALALEEIGNPKAAIADWTALLELPEEALLTGWAKQAQQHLLILNPPTSTPTLTATSTSLPSRTPTPPKATSTSKPSITPTPSRTTSPNQPTNTPGSSTLTGTPLRWPTKTPTPALSTATP